jgi:hypothetical protein
MAPYAKAGTGYKVGKGRTQTMGGRQVNEDKTADDYAQEEGFGSWQELKAWRDLYGNPPDAEDEAIERAGSDYNPNGPTLVERHARGLERRSSGNGDLEL